MPIDEQLMLAAAAAIREYLSTRPNAKDTAEGIHQWWIPQDAGAGSLGVTVAALDHLEAEGFLEHVQSGSRKLWRKRDVAPAAGGDGGDTQS